jgi:hypothetical protein
MRILLLLVTLLFITAYHADAAMYEWTDDQGGVNFTDDPDRIPARYRNRAQTRESIKKAPGAAEKVAPERQPVTPAKARSTAPVYGERQASWWRSSFTRLRTEIESQKQSLTVRNNELLAVKRKMTLYHRRTDRTNYNELNLEIDKIEERIAELQKQLQLLESEADAAGVPGDLRN